jgi:peptidyl-prolyl cis-trans isomerase D
LYSDNAHPTIKQYFSQDGVFSPSNVINFRNQVAAKDPKSMEQFELIVKQIVLETKSRKYTSLISKSMYATALDAEDDFFASSAEAKGKSITLNFGNLEDKDFKVTDDELKSYLKKHASDFKQKEGRDLEYIMLSVLPTKQDTMAIKQEVESLIPTFRTTDNDSLYVAINSSEPFDPYFQSRGTYDKAIESRLFSAPKDSVIGPLYANGVFSLVKVIDSKLDSVSYITAFRAEIYVKGTTKQDTLDAIAKAKKLAAESKSSADPFSFLQQKTTWANLELLPIWDGSEKEHSLRNSIKR